MLRRLLLCTCVMLCCSCAAGGPRNVDLASPKPVTLSEFKANPALLKDLEGAFSSETPCVLLLEQGQTLPLVLEMSTPAVTMAPVTGQLAFHRDVYVRISKKGMYLSADGKIWTAIGDVDQTKAILGVGHASLSLALKALAGEGAGAVLSVNGTAWK